ncbi:DUF2399 domain-containing protein [Streptomyces wuyuanensis]|uniref:DUF2399 domain-containing protein n=1 Tax=Streptomyces wuyuanensis TaxID=1196353 RepID=UPI00370FCBB2
MSWPRSGSRFRPLTGAQTRTPWDPDLAEALAEAGIRVEEERELDLLLSDLRGRPRTRCPGCVSG